MFAVDFFLHWFTPHHTNAHRPKILHQKSLLLLVVGILLVQGLISVTARVAPSILGYAANISPEKVVELTNRERVQRGLEPLRLDNALSEAALAKAGNMFAKNYWAHVAPDGTQPWAFITASGYRYIHAGENLARDFSSPESVVGAWMNSQSHKDNLLSPKYHDIGVAVVDGTLGGVETTLVVQLFGARTGTAPSTPVVAAKIQVPVSPTPTAVPSATPLVATARQETAGKSLVQEAGAKPLFNPYTLSKAFSSTIVTIIIVALVFDMVLVWRRRLLRLSGRSWAHLTFLLAMLVSLIIIRGGNIL